MPVARPSLAACRLLAVFALAWAAPAHAWWNCAWQSRVPLTVQAAGPGTNVVVEAVLPAAALPGYGWSGADADLRVVDQDDATVLPHWSDPRPGGVQRLRVFFRAPAIGPTPRRVHLYYGNAAATATSDSALFTAPGVRALTRRLSAASHGTLAQFFDQFDAATSPVGYGCAVLPDYVGRASNSMFGSGTDIHFSAMFFLDVPAGSGGAWSFRLGPDYGLGGALYVNGQAVGPTRWGQDLWWGGSFGSSQLLEGTINLPPGRHFVVTYGSEACCDGPQTLQVRGPTGPWRDLRSSNFTIVAPSCPVAGLAVARVADDARFLVRQLSSTFEDPFSGTTTPKSIPGARKRYTLRVTDNGPGRVVDADSMRIVVPVPANTRLYVRDLGAPGSGPVRFVDGSPPSGLLYAYAGLGSAADDLAFSNDGGTTWGYVPVPTANGTDPAVTHVRVSPRGRPACTTGGPERSFDLEIDVVVL